LKNKVKFSLIFAAIWIFYKLILFWFGSAINTVTPSIFGNIFCLLAAISVGLFIHKKNETTEKGNAINDIKTSLSVGMPYAVIVSLFIYVYYSKIDPEYNQRQIHKAQVLIDKTLKNEVKFEEHKKENEAFEVMSKERIRKELIKGPKSFYTASATSLVSLLSLMMLSTFYSILLTVIYRKFIFRN
jgi:hypothetical protein